MHHITMENILANTSILHNPSTNKTKSQIDVHPILKQEHVSTIAWRLEAGKQKKWYGRQ
jgi:hypothetical protein